MKIGWLKVLPLCIAALLAAPGGLCPPAQADSIELSSAAPGAGVLDEQLAALVRALLAENPEILAARNDARSAAERVHQAGSLPDPQLSYRYYLQSPETRVGPMRQALELNQVLPWGGKRSRQAEREEHRAGSAKLAVRDLEREMIAVLKRAYFEAAYLQEAVAVNDEEANLLREFERTALRRYSTGDGIQQDVLKIQTEISRHRDRRAELRRRLDAIELKIAELLGQPALTTGLSPIVLEFPPLPQLPDEFIEEALQSHPRIGAVRERIEADRSWAERRRLESRPDFRIGIAYTQVDDRDDPAAMTMPPEDNGQDIVALSLGISLPIHRKQNRAGVAEANASLRSGEARMRSLKNRLHFEIDEAHLRLQTLEERARLYEEVIVPQAEVALQSVRSAYATDRQGFLDLLDAQRVLFESRLTFRRLLADAWIACADLELAAHRPVAELERPAARVGEAGRAGPHGGTGG